MTQTATILFRLRIKSQAQRLTQMGHLRGIPVHQGAGYYRKTIQEIGSVVKRDRAGTPLRDGLLLVQRLGWASSTGSGLARALQNP